jgi:hypothetical protein
LLPLLSSLNLSYSTESLHLSNCETTRTNGTGDFSSEID